MIEMIDEIIEMIDNVSDMFYKQRESQGYDMLNQLIGKLVNLTKSLGDKAENKEYI